MAGQVGTDARVDGVGEEDVLPYWTGTRFCSWGDAKALARWRHYF